MGELVTSTMEDIKKNSVLLNYQKQNFVKNVASKARPTPPNYKEIISINRFDRKLPPTLPEIYELEIGPNRCGTTGDISTDSRIENNNAAKNGNVSSDRN